MLLVLVFGAIESANAIFLKQSLTIGAYEAAKAATTPQGTSTFATQRCSEVLAVRDITSFQITYSPASITETLARGPEVSVTVTVNADSAATGPLWIFSGQPLSATIKMVRL